MRTNRAVKAIAYILFLALTVAGLAEAVLRTGRFAPRFESLANTRMTLDREVLYRVVPLSNPEINSSGYRDTEFGPKQAGIKRILFLGDSFVSGIGGMITSNNTMPQYLESMLAPEGYEVFNMGIYGYGPDQSLMQLRAEGLGYSPDAVVLAVFPDNDWGDIVKNRLVRLDARGVARYNPSNIVAEAMTRSRLVYLIKYALYKHEQRITRRVAVDLNADFFDGLFAALFQDGFDTTLMDGPGSEAAGQRRSLMRGILRGFQEELEPRGVPFVVLIIPSHHSLTNHTFFEQRGTPPEKYFVNTDEVAAICADLGIHHINLHEVVKDAELKMPLYLSGQFDDNHLSPYGNWISALVIHNYMIRAGLVPEARTP